MNSHASAESLPILLTTLLMAVSTVDGCGMMPPGQSRSRNFTITGFTLPVAMVYSAMQNIAAQAPGIAPNAAGARAFVQRIVTQAVLDVLEQQGRGAGLSDAIISIILGQLTVQTVYTPLECPNAFVNPMPMDMNMIMMNQVYCIIVGSTVTAICSTTMANQNCVTGAGTNVMPVPPTALTIGGTLTTTNVIMANWSREMWQSVVNRVVRSLASGPFGSNFVTASGVVT